MKKTSLALSFALAISSVATAQNGSMIADRFRAFINTEYSGWHNQEHYLSITNKTIMKKTIFMATMITAAMTVNAQINTKDEDAIRFVVKTMETGWVEKSGEKFASVFADVHDFIVWNGYYLPNSTRQRTAAGHQNLFNGPYKNLDVCLKVDKIKFIRKDIVLVHTYGAMYEKGKAVPENPGVLMSILMEKKDDNWQILSFHNLDLEGFKDKEVADRSPIPFNIMYAGWYKK